MDRVPFHPQSSFVRSSFQRNGQSALPPTKFVRSFELPANLVRSFERTPKFIRSFVRSSVPQRSLVRAPERQELLAAGQLERAVTLGPTGSVMSDLQHVDASREGSQEPEDGAEDGDASGFVSPSRPAAAAPDTESRGAAARGRKRARAAAQGRPVQPRRLGTESESPPTVHKSR